MAKGSLKKAETKDAEVNVQASVVEETTQQTTTPEESGAADNTEQILSDDVETVDNSGDETTKEQTGDGDDETAGDEGDESGEETTTAPTITVDTEAPKPEVTVQKTESKTTKEQTVRIKMAKDHKCHIGGQWYYLEAGKCYNVPENVKRILLNSGLNLLAPL